MGEKMLCLGRGFDIQGWVRGSKAGHTVGIVLSCGFGISGSRCFLGNSGSVGSREEGDEGEEDEGACKLHVLGFGFALEQCAEMLIYSRR